MVRSGSRLGIRPLLAAAVLGAIAAWLAAKWPTRSLWYDETVTAYFAQHSWSELWEWCTRIDNQMPLDFALRKLWGTLAGTSEFALRSFSVGWALVASAGAVALGQRVSGRLAGGWLAALAFALTQSFLYAAYEVRPYALALALFALSSMMLWSLIERYAVPLRPLDGGYKRRLAAYVVLALAMLYTHYTAFFALAAQGAVLLLRAGPHISKRQAVIGSHLGLGLALGYVPWLIFLAGRDVRAGTAFAGHIAPLRALDAYAQFYVYGQNVPLLTGPRYHVLAPSFAVLAMVAGLAAYWRGRTPWKGVLWAAAATVVPLLSLLVMVFAVQAKLSGRHAWPVWLGVALTFAVGVTALRRPRIGRWIIAAAVLLALWLPSRLTLQPVYNSYLREAFAYIADHAAAGDVLVLRDGTLFTAASYYRAGVPWTGLPRDRLLDVNRFLFVDEAVSGLSQLVADHHARRVWVLAWQGDIMDPQNLIAGILEMVGDPQPLYGATGFGDVHVSLYTLRDQPTTVVRVLDSMAPLVQIPPDGPVLLGGEVLSAQRVPRGGQLEVQTWWLRGGTLYRDLRMSVRLYDASGTFHSQVDQPPVGWSFGQEHWQSGVPVLSRTFLRVPPDMPRGRAYVKVVIYDIAGEIAPITVDMGDVEVTGAR